ncbi:MAG: hypothetical protein FWG21_06420 [Oscillospiraceae bacterium]|nr:hypothetical protein [Oscillospiraceae bacterium]
MTDKRFINYAHRGASSYAPENTFAAFYKGVELNANGIETDIQVTEDGELVLHHDDTLQRICGIDQKVSDLTLRQLRELDFGGFFSDRWKNEKIVTLKDFLGYFAAKPLMFAIELKAAEIEYELLDICRHYLDNKQYHITSFSLDSVLKLAEVDNAPRLGFLSTEFNRNTISLLVDASVEQYCPYAPELNQEQMDYLRTLDFNIRAWGISDTEVMAKAYNLGVDGMTVNFPDRLNELILSAG